jgi:hypothetical protein
LKGVFLGTAASVPILAAGLGVSAAIRAARRRRETRAACAWVRWDRPRARPGLRYAHTVQRGESLSAVADRAGVSGAQLVRLNRLRRPDHLLPGQTLILRRLVTADRSGKRVDLLAELRPADVRVEVFKAERRLELRLRGVLFKRYPVGLGSSPAGDKRVEGDGRTPEGDFYVCQRLPAGRYGPSLGVSYPALPDARRGLRDGLISDRAARAISESLRLRQRPLWNTALGGAICIHGRGASRDWTAGCVALEDADAGELFPLVPMGAAVRIRATKRRR